MWKRRPDISGGFLLLLAWFVLENGWQPLLVIVIASFCHEAGHLFALRLFQAPVTALRIQSFGAVLEVDHSRLSYCQELLAVLAGPVTNLMLGGLLSLLANGREFWYQMAGAQLILGLYNLLPIRALDGGQALNLLLLSLEHPMECLQSAVSWTCALCTVAFLLYVMRISGGSLWLLPAVFALLHAAR